MKRESGNGYVCRADRAPNDGTFKGPPPRRVPTATSAGPVDTVPPNLKLSGKKKQEFGKALKVKASCGDEACTARAEVILLVLGQRGFPGGEVFKPASADLGPGETTTLKLKTRPVKGWWRGIRKKARKALDEGKKVRAVVEGDATDAAGNVATAERTIRLVK